VCVGVEEVKAVVRLSGSVVSAGAMWYSSDAKGVHTSLEYTFASQCSLVLTSGNSSLADLNAMLKPRVSVREAQHSYVTQ
jgi:hypothetical protein